MKHIKNKNEFSKINEVKDRILPDILYGWVNLFAKPGRIWCNETVYSDESYALQHKNDPYYLSTNKVQWSNRDNESNNERNPR